MLLQLRSSGVVLPNTIGPEEIPVEDVEETGVQRAARFSVQLGLPEDEDEGELIDLMGRW
jgi:hypothetical protein